MQPIPYLINKAQTHYISMTVCFNKSSERSCRYICPNAHTTKNVMNNETAVIENYRQNDWKTFALRTVHIRLGCTVRLLVARLELGMPAVGLARTFRIIIKNSRQYFSL